MPGLTLITSESATLEYSGDGSTFHEVPFIGDISASGGEAPETDVVTFKRIGKLIGKLRVPSLSIAVPSYAPNHATWQAIVNAAKAQTPLSWRVTTKEEEFYEASGAGNTVAIAITGIAAFAGTKPDFTSENYAEGMVIEAGAGKGNKYVIDTISSAGVVTVKPAPDPVVTAKTDYKIINPSLRLGPFVASVRSAGNFELATEGNLTTTLELTPRAQLPNWVIV